MSRDQSPPPVVAQESMYRTMETAPLGRRVIVYTRHGMAILHALSQKDVSLYAGWAPLPDATAAVKLAAAKLRGES